MLRLLVAFTVLSSTVAAADPEAPRTKDIVKGVVAIALGGGLVIAGDQAAVHANLEDGWFDDLNRGIYRGAQVTTAIGGAAIVGGAHLIMRRREVGRAWGIGTIALGVAGGVATFVKRDDLDRHQVTAWTLSATTAAIGTLLLVDTNAVVVPQRDGAVVAYGGTF